MVLYSLWVWINVLWHVSIVISSLFYVINVVKKTGHLFWRLSQYSRCVCLLTMSFKVPVYPENGSFRLKPSLDSGSNVLGNIVVIFFNGITGIYESYYIFVPFCFVYILILYLAILLNSPIISNSLSVNFLVFSRQIIISSVNNGRFIFFSQCIYILYITALVRASYKMLKSRGDT